MADPVVSIVKTGSLPFDPRYEQMRTQNVRPAVRTFTNSRPRDSSRLLLLPDEILWRITDFIAASDQGANLSSFALTHRECRQIARPYQFADIFLTLNDYSRALLQHVRHEQDGKTAFIGPAITDCIRTISVDFKNDLDVDYGINTNDDMDKWLKTWQPVADNLAEMLDEGLPNLERIDWVNVAELELEPHPIHDMISGPRNQESGGSMPLWISRLRELNLRDYEFLTQRHNDYNLPPPPTIPLPIRSLAFGYTAQWDVWTDDAMGLTGLVAENVIRRCAPTLESFIWVAEFLGRANDALTEYEAFTFRNGPIDFPRLTKFWTGYKKDHQILMNPEVLRCLLRAPLRSLGLSGCMAEMIMHFELTAEYQLSNLKTLAVTAAGEPPDWAKNYDEFCVRTVMHLAAEWLSGIEELFVYPQARTNIMIKSLSSGSFSNLTSLCMTWTNDPKVLIPRCIGRHLHSLEDLAFCFKPSNDRTYDEDLEFETGEEDTIGSPFHEKIITELCPLKHLKRISLFADEYIAYHVGDDWAIHRFYKEHVKFYQGRSFSRPADEATPALRGHCRPGNKQSDWRACWLLGFEDEAQDEALVEVAARYAKNLPALEGMILGRVLIQIGRK